MKTVFNEIAIKIPEVLLPSKNTNLEKWAVIACDQYTSQPQYWEKTAEYIKDSPSALKIILPEVFLGTNKENILIDNIHNEMNMYLEKNILEQKGPGLFLCERKTNLNTTRKGLICCLDLESYDYSKKSQSLIRPTEGTIIERIPPRIKVREKAALETPHIMVLIDDPEKKVIEPLFESENKIKIYDFNLMNNSGSLTGFFIDDESIIDKTAENIASLIDKEQYGKKYNIGSEESPLLFAMGDGNHSFATAKAWWEKVKEENKDDEDIMNHPARWALVEIVNIHDPSILFEPIHRIIFDTEPEKIISDFKNFFEQRGSKVLVEYTSRLENPAPDKEKYHEISFVYKNTYGIMKISDPVRNIAAGDLQDALNSLCAKLKVDYIHGKNHLMELSEKDSAIGFLLPPIKKNNFFKSIIKDGALPRKSFSMGEADDKRFYMECRKIVK